MGQPPGRLIDFQKENLAFLQKQFEQGQVNLNGINKVNNDLERAIANYERQIQDIRRKISENKGESNGASSYRAPQSSGTGQSYTSPVVAKQPELVSQQSLDNYLNRQESFKAPVAAKAPSQEPEDELEKYLREQKEAKAKEE